jgi:hypothetical protein
MIQEYSIVHYVIVMLMIMIFVSCKMFFHLRCSWVECCFYHSTRIKWKFKINEKWHSIVKYGVLTFIELIGVHLHEDTIMNQFSYSWFT